PGRRGVRDARARDARRRRREHGAGGARGRAVRVPALASAALALLRGRRARGAREGRGHARDVAARDRPRAPRGVRRGCAEPGAREEARRIGHRARLEALPKESGGTRVSRAVGIDLGTSNSVVAVIDQDGAPRILTTPEGSTMLPSLVWFSGDGPVVGEAARA